MDENTKQNKLEILAEKYGYQTKTPNPKAQVYKTFDKAYENDKSTLKRISQTPTTGTHQGTIGDIHAEMAGIQLDLTELTDEYGSLNLRFKTLVGKDKIYNIGDAAKLTLYGLIGNKKASSKVKLEAVKRRGDAIEYLVNRMGEVLQDQYQKAIDAKKRGEDLQVGNTAHMRQLDRKLIESLKSGYYTATDHTAAQKEIDKLNAEIAEIDDTLKAYEKEVNLAKAENNLEMIVKLTDEMSQVLDIKHGVLDGRLSAEGVVLEIRRQILDSAEGVQSAKGAIAASKVNYQALSALIDSMTELEIKYKHALEDMIPVFRIQGAISGLGTQALGMKKALTKTAEISQHLMEANVKLITCLAAETFELLKNPLYSLETAKAAEERISTYRAQLNDLKMQWAQAQQDIDEVSKVLSGFEVEAHRTTPT
ncbi:hypothetical protein FJZ53_00715 [Candidatus Woesearchaeota archaeon]|nr:hypothetical protein [Candidatus Woesearchaeota archaeon]